MSKNGWSDGTLTTVRALWAMLIATVMISGAMFYVLPHLSEDGLTRDDAWIFGGLVLVAFVMALPHVFMQAIGGVVGAYRTWRANGKGS